MYKRILTAVGIFLLTAISLNAATFNLNLSVTSRGEEVKKVQQFLIDKGFLSGAVTGYFGDLTKKAVQSFQKQNGLPATGAWFALTRQKANGIMPLKVSSSSSALSASMTSLPDIGTSQNKTITLTLITQGGILYNQDGTIACYSFEKCKKTVPVGSKISFKLTVISGYSISGWSEASCGVSLECTVLAIEDLTLESRTKIQNLKRTGHIVYPTGTDICYVGLGQDTCNVPVYWNSDTGLDVTLKVDGKEYYITLQEKDAPEAKYPVNPDIVLKNEPQNIMGPVYFPLTPETYTFDLRSGGQVLDSVKVEVKCVPGYYLQYGRTCWQDGAKRLVVFKQPGILIKSDVPGIACGYQFETCSAAFPNNSKITLTATALPGYAFSGWTGECTSTSNTCTFVMDKEKSVGVKNQ